MDLREAPRHQFERHPWEVARAKFFADLLATVLETRRHAAVRLLDIGAGDGYVAERLLERVSQLGDVTCVDPNYEDAFLAAANGRDERLRFLREAPDARFDVLTMLDVVEHVRDDAVFVADLVDSHLAEDGVVLISVPSWMLLYSNHDVSLGHYRRYRSSQIAKVAEATGLRVVRRGGLFHSLLAPRLAKSVWERLRGVRIRPNREAEGSFEIASWRHGRLFTALVHAVLSLDNRVSRLSAAVRLNIPGLSTWILATRP